MARTLQEGTPWSTRLHWKAQGPRDPQLKRASWAATTTKLLWWPPSNRLSSSKRFSSDPKPGLTWLELRTQITMEVTTHVVSLATHDNTGVKLGVNRKKQDASGWKKLYCEMLQHHPQHHLHHHHSQWSTQSEGKQRPVRYSCMHQLKTSWSVSTTCRQFDLIRKERF